MGLKIGVGGTAIVTMLFLTLVSAMRHPVISIKNMPPPIMKTISADNVRTDSLLENLLQANPAYFDTILQNREQWNVQIIYTQVDRGANGIAALKNYYFNLDNSRYFYPASTVKLPVSMLALQKLNELKISGLDRNATMITEKNYSGQTPVYNDPTTPNGKPSIAQYIRKILMVSDNDAFNRLYEFLGPAYINEQLRKKGYGTAQILHRLNISLSADENRHTNPVKFLDSQNNILLDQPMRYDTTLYSGRKDFLGNGYYSGVQVVNQPMDFSLKNRLNLEDLHSILTSLVFPNKMRAAQRFGLTDDDRDFLLKYMSQLPIESSFPPYSADTASYWPAYCKFLLVGSEKGPLPKNIRIFNKVGDAYGQLTDVAYIIDQEKKIEFFLSATIYCNNDGILNDDLYDYELVGLPFMKHLGQVIYDHELKRERKIIPDLSHLVFAYDKP